jgi:hypothetical protein
MEADDGATIACLLGTAAASGQPAQKPLMAEDVFKNVQVLKGIPVNQFMETMSFFSASLATTARIATSPTAWATGRSMPKTCRRDGWRA